MNTTQQPEALPALIERFRGLHFYHAPDGWPAVRTREITALLDRITELESQLAQRFDAEDMATAAAQGFRDGVAKDQQAGWRPIETAPKDGTEILGYTEDVGALVLYWDSMTGEMDHWSDGMSVSFWKPTQWMPLPPAPGPGPADGESNG